MGARGLGGWLDTAPWVSGGGIRCVRVATLTDYENIVEVIEQRVLAIDRRQSAVRLVEMDCTSRPQFVEDLQMELGLDEHGSGSTALDQLAVRLRHIPLVVAVVHLDQTGFEAARRTTEQFIDQLVRLEQPGTLCVLLFGSHSMPRDGKSDDFSTGLPSGLEVLGLRSQPYLLWAAYLHYRLSWESGGNRRLADSLGRGLRALTLGADDELEDYLNCHARRRWLDTDEELRGKAKIWSARYGNPTPEWRLSIEPLLEEGLLWRPSPSSTVRFTAWAARALLLERRDAPGRDMLRACLVCLPLARALLESCFDLETELRCSLGDNEGDVTTAKGREILSELGDHRRVFEADAHPMRQFYPVASPAVPRTLASFSSVGQLRYLSRWSRREFRAIECLTTLRNALAHGHYVTWRMVSLLGEVELAKASEAWRY